MLGSGDAAHRRTCLKTVAMVAAFGTSGCLSLSEDESGATDDSRVTDQADDSTHTDDEVEPVDFAVDTVATGLEHPWGMAFLPDDSRLLVTERPGRLTLVDRVDGTVERVDGAPDVDARGQGGLLDVTLHPDFPEEPWVYLTYAAATEGGESATHLGRARLDPDGARLTDHSVLHVAEPFVDSQAHYGSRVVVGAEGMLYVTSGDRQFKDFGPDHVAQDTSNELGTTLRLALDGSIPTDNPFRDDPDARDAIFSYGHRNPQGLTIHPTTGDIWASEHGEQDGDELNILEAGGNFGWPVAHYGCTYREGEPIGVAPDERDEVVNPVQYWECGTGGFPPGGMAFYEGEAFPQWRGDLFVGNLAGQYVGRLRVEGRNVEEIESLLVDREWRIRDVSMAPDTDDLYVLVDAANAPIVRLVPAEVDRDR